VEKAYNDQLSRLRETKENQDIEWESINQKSNIILHRMKEIENVVKSQQNKLQQKMKLSARKELISSQISPALTERTPKLSSEGGQYAAQCDKDFKKHVVSSKDFGS